MTRISDEDLRRKYVEELEQRKKAIQIVAPFGVVFSMIMLVLYVWMLSVDRITSIFWASIFWIGFYVIIPTCVSIFFLTRISKLDIQINDNRRMEK